MFTPEDVRKIARLSALELDEEEIETFARQFTEILGYFEVLKSAPVSDELEEAVQHLPEEGREDRQVSSPVTPDQFSPYLENGFFKVPRVIDPGS